MGGPAAQARDLPDILAFVACAFVVAFFAMKRYNTPETNRLSTTRVLFMMTGAGYVLTSLVLFSALSEIVLRPGMLSFLGVQQAQEVLKKYADPAILSAVLLTTLLPNVAVMSLIDKWLLARFQEWGRIPQGVRFLADSLKPESLCVPDEALRDLREWITVRADIPSDLAARIGSDRAGTSRGDLTRVLLIHRALERLSASGAYANAFRIKHVVWEDLSEELAVFAAQSFAFFVLFDKLSPMEGSAVESAYKQARQRYAEICRKTYSRQSELLAQLLLMVEGSDARIQRQARFLGFQSSEYRCPPMPLGALAFTCLMMVLTIFCFVAAFPISGPGPLPLWLAGVLIGVTQAAGLAAATLPKLRWTRFRHVAGHPPYSGWLASAAVAGLFGLIVDRAAIAAASHDVAAALDFFRYPLHPVGPMAALMALVVAILCDLDLGLGEGWGRRVTEGALCGAALTIGILVFTQLVGLRASTATAQAPWLPIIFSFSVGFLGGFAAPHLYREALSEREAADVNLASARAGI